MDKNIVNNVSIVSNVDIKYITTIDENGNKITTEQTTFRNIPNVRSGKGIIVNN